MTKWLRRLCGAVGVGITWAVGWAGVGFLIELFVDPRGRIADIRPMVLGIPDFFGGAIFAVMLGMAEGRRRRSSGYYRGRRGGSGQPRSCEDC
jgi:hypothetical protein